MNRPGSAEPSSAQRWMVVAGVSALVALTVIAGFYLPTYREAARLRREGATLLAEHGASIDELARAQTELAKSRAENAALRQEAVSAESSRAAVRERMEKLERLLSAQFGRLAQAKVLLVSSAADRMSVALAVPALFSARDRLTPNGRELLCQLAKVIMSEFDGPIRVSGYYGKDRLDPADARRGSPWHLAAARAASAADALGRDCEAPTDRFMVVSYGPRAAGPLGPNVALEFIFGPEDAAPEP